MILTLNITSSSCGNKGLFSTPGVQSEGTVRSTQYLDGGKQKLSRTQSSIRCWFFLRIFGTFFSFLHRESYFVWVGQMFGRHDLRPCCVIYMLELDRPLMIS